MERSLSLRSKVNGSDLTLLQVVTQYYMKEGEKMTDVFFVIACFILIIYAIAALFEPRKSTKRGIYASKSTKRGIERW